MYGSRAIYKDGWWACTKLDKLPWDFSPATLAKFAPGSGWDPDKDVWELYYLPDDFSQAHDLAAEHPEKLAELKDLFWEEAERNRALPLLAASEERLLDCGDGVRLQAFHSSPARRGRAEGPVLAADAARAAEGEVSRGVLAGEPLGESRAFECGFRQPRDLRVAEAAVHEQPDEGRIGQERAAVRVVGREHEAPRIGR